MTMKIQALEKKHIWEMIDLHIDKKPVRCKWVFIIKYKINKTIERYKAILIAKGYT